MTERPRLPEWLRVPYRGAEVRDDVRRLLRGLNLHTVCENARCPNHCECWAHGTATFLILGNVCTRGCRFCAVTAGRPAPSDPDEPRRLAEAAAGLGLRYVVITSVTRDDLPDGGAAHFAATVRAVRERLPGVGIEVLTPDFGGRETELATVLAAGPEVFNHNLETCRRLTPAIRAGATYDRSLAVLRTAHRLPAPPPGRGHAPARIKSGFMLGLGETTEEIREMLGDLRAAEVELLVIGQYLPPSRQHWPLARYVPPAEFATWEHVARTEFEFAAVVSRPLARSSYLAEQLAQGTGKK